MAIKRTVLAALVGTLAAAALGGCSSGSASSEASGSGSNPLGLLSAGHLRVGTVTDNRPYSYIENGKNTGLDMEIMRGFAKQQHLQIDIRQMDWAALMPAVASKQLDAASATITITPERKKNVAFSDPYMVGPVAVLTAKTSGIDKQPSSLDGKRLGLVQGTLTDQYAQEHFHAQIVRFPDTTSGYTALQTGSIDAFFTDEPIARAFAEKNDKMTLAQVITKDQAPFGMVFNKNNPALRKAFNAYLHELISDGQLVALQKKYLPEVATADMFKPKA